MADVSFEEAVLCGCASDGGLFLPASFPKLSREEMKAWAALSYPQLVGKFLRLFVDPEELSDQEIRGRQVHVVSQRSAGSEPYDSCTFAARCLGCRVKLGISGKTF